MTLSLEDLHFSYRRDSPVLRGVTLNVESGELVGLVGPNGGGKTTLLRCAAGLLDPEGTVRYGGVSLGDLSHRARAKRRAFSAQTVDYPFPYSVEEAVSMGLAHSNALYFQPESGARVQSILDELGSDVELQSRVDRLSGGQRQLALLARALIQGTEILLLDEPTSALDLRHAALAFRALRERAKRGGAVLMSIHNMNVALQACDRLVFLHEGRVLASGLPEEVVTQELLDEIYGEGVVRVWGDGPVVRVEFERLARSNKELEGEDEVPVVPPG